MAMLDAPDANSPAGNSSYSLCSVGHATVSATTHRVSPRETVLRVWRVGLGSYIRTKDHVINTAQDSQSTIIHYGTVFSYILW